VGSRKDPITQTHIPSHCAHAPRRIGSQGQRAGGGLHRSRPARTVLSCPFYGVPPGYNKRSRVEAAIGRYKQVIGDGLRSRGEGRRSTEVGIAVRVLNQMLESDSFKLAHTQS
jgi:hypothetical protein